MDLAQKPVYKLDLAAGTSVVNLTTPLVEGDDRAQTFTLELTDKGAPANLKGYSVTAYFGRGKTAEAEADTIPLSGTVSGNVATITLTESCYSRSCYFSMPIRLSNGATGQKRTYLIVRGTVVKSVDGRIIDPDGSVPSLDDLFAQIAVMERSRQAAEEATEEALVAASRADEAREGIQGDLATLTEEMTYAGINNVDLLRDEYVVDNTAYYFANGSTLANNNYVSYRFIPCVPGERLTLPVIKQAHVSFYDVNKAYLNGELKDFTVDAGTEYAKASFIDVPDNAFYITVSIPKSHLPAVMGTVEPFLTDSTKPIKALGEDFMPNLYTDDIVNVPAGIVKKSGPNLFDKKRVINGYYCNYTNGVLAVNASYCTLVIEVQGGTKYSFDAFNGCHFVWLDTDAAYISGFLTATPAQIQTVEAPANAKYIAVSIDKSNADDAVFCEGETAVCSEYGSGAVYAVECQRCLTVGEEKQYSTIQSAVDAAGDGDTVIVYPGTYVESVSNKTEKYVSIVGVDRESCIIKYSLQDYDHPPLEIARGTLKNLTVIGTTDGEETGHTAYCLHCDFGGSQGTADSPVALYAENCRFVSNMVGRSAIGVGLKRYFTCEFVNCEFECTANGPAVYVHTWEVASGVTNLVKQRFVMKNCTAHNSTAAANPTIQFQSQEWPNTDAVLLFQNNVVINEGGGETIGMHIYRDNGGACDKYMGSSDWTLSPYSYGNNVQGMNA